MIFKLLARAVLPEDLYREVIFIVYIVDLYYRLVRTGKSLATAVIVPDAKTSPHFRDPPHL